MDQFLQKLFFQTGLILLRSRVLLTLAIIAISYASVILCDFKVTFLGEREDAAFTHFSIVFCL